MITYTVKVFDGGSIHWYLDNKRHRVGAPAVTKEDGTQLWYINGKLHRTDGAAIEYADGDKVWYINGIRYTEEEFNTEMQHRTTQVKELSVADIEKFLGYIIKVIA